MQRLIGVILASFVAMLVVGPVFLPILYKLKFGQPIRDDGPKSHAAKKGTPTMGGVMMLLVFALSALAFVEADGRMELMVPAVLFTVGFALIGFLDDYLKVVRKNPKGLRGWYKIFGQAALSIGVALFCYNHPSIGSSIYIPFTDILWDMGIFYIPFVMFVVIAMVNSANLMDGLDGLLSGNTLIMAATLAIIALFAVSVLDPVLARTVAVFAGAGAGVCLGFLRFNTHPAKVFMGDTGSFLLGAIVTISALFLKQPLLLLIICITYVATALSDIIQIGYFKLSGGKRVFRMAPLHHHFELGGMPETQIVAIYMIVTFVACLIALLAVS